MKKTFLIIFIAIVFLLTGCDSVLRKGPYDVIFETNGGNTINSLVVEQGGKIDLPTPTKAGFVFDGWYSEEKTSYKEFTSTSIVNKNTTLYAKWRITNITFGGRYDETFNSIVEVSVGNFVAVGEISSNGSINQGFNEEIDGLIVKFNSEGNIIWDKTIGGTNMDGFNSVIEDSEGNYVVVGYTHSNDNDIADGNNGEQDALIMKLDSEGNIIWDKTIGGSTYDGFDSIIEDSEGNYVVVGFTGSDDFDITDGNNGEYGDALIMKLDSEGNIIWDKTSGGISDDGFLSVVEDDEGNYVAVGNTWTNDFYDSESFDGEYNALIIKYDTDGNIIWNKTIGGSSEDGFRSIVQDLEGDYVVVGFTWSSDYDITDRRNGKFDALIMKLDTKGNILWHKTVGGSDVDFLSSIIVGRDGNYITAGLTTSDDYEISDGNNGYFDALIIKFDTEGNIIWDKTIGGSSDDSFRSVIEDSNGFYVAVGYTGSDDYDIIDGNNSDEFYDDGLIWSE